MKALLNLLFILLISLPCEAQTVSFAWTNYNSGNSGLLYQGMSCFDVDALGRVWIGYPQGYMQMFDGTNWVTFNYTNSGIPPEDITSIYCEGDSVVWIATDGGGLVKYTNSTWTVYNTANSTIPIARILKIKPDKKGNLWGTNRFDLFMFDKTNFYTFPTTLESTEDLCFEDTLHFWKSSINDGLFKYDLSDTSFIQYSTSNSNLISNGLGCLMLDKSNNLWAGYYGQCYCGITRFDGMNFQNYNPYSSDSFFTFRNITMDTSGILYSITNHGLLYFQNSNWNHYPFSGFDTVYYPARFIDADSYNRLWIGCPLTGLWVSNIFVGVNEIENSNPFSIYPNPAFGSLTINSISNSSLTITDAIGKKVKETFLPEGKKEIDISNLSAGIYFLTLENNTTRTTQKLVKQ